jgi:hypothetical protein
MAAFDLQQMPRKAPRADNRCSLLRTVIEVGTVGHRFQRISSTDILLVFSGTFVSMLPDGAVRRMRTRLSFPVGFNSGHAQLTPLGESGGSVKLEVFSGVEVAFLVEMIVN